MLLLSWGIHIGGCCKLLGALIGVVTLGSAFITSHLRLVLSCNRHNIASSPWGSIGVVGDIVVVELGQCTDEIARVAGVVVVVSSGPWVSSSTVGIGWTVHRGSIVSWGKSCRRVGAILCGMVGSCLIHHSTLAVLIGLVDLAFHLNGRVH